MLLGLLDAAHEVAKELAGQRCTENKSACGDAREGQQKEPQGIVAVRKEIDSDSARCQDKERREDSKSSDAAAYAGDRS